MIPESFVGTLEKNRVRLRLVDTRALASHFSARDGRVSVPKFLQWVQIDPPEDHVDPELVFAQLPQPFRRIAKVLEQDILDASWEIIKTSSTRYKAELSAAAALSVRSARSIALHVGNEALEADDYEDARKRCCKSFGWIQLKSSSQQESPSLAEVVGMTTHASLPLLLAGLESLSGGSVSFQLINTALKRTMDQVFIGQAPGSLGSTSEPATTTTVYRITSMTPIQTRSNCAGPVSVVSLVFAAHVVEDTCSYEDTDSGPQAVSTLTSHVHVYEIRDILLPLEETHEECPRISLVAKASFVESVASISLSQDGKLLALATKSSEVSVYILPPEDPRVTLETETVVADLCSAAVPQMKLASIPESKQYPIQMHFLVAAETQSTVLPEVVNHVHQLKTYAIAICSHTKLLKYTLPASTVATPLAPYKIWTHLTAIATSVLDTTTQYLAVGLSDGSGGVWNVLDDIDHAYLPAVEASVAGYDTIVLHRHQFIAALSTTSQQCVFFDLTDRSNPKLLRTVTPSTSGSGSSQQRADVCLTTLVRSTTALDIPVALLGYSNGLLLAYDMRNAEAIGGIRYPIEKFIPANVVVGEGYVLATQDCIAIANAKSTGSESLSALQVFDWAALLLTCFPAFDRMLKQRNLDLVGRVQSNRIGLSSNDLTNVPQCAENAKRLFLGSLETETTSGQESTGDAIESLLRKMAGLKPVVAKIAAGQGRSANQEPKSVTVPPLLLFENADSSHELPQLVAPPQQPLRPDMAALFDQYRREHLGVFNWPPDRDAKLHRRRKEMLKAFAASSW